ncbi:MAG: DedA family protein [Thermoleophilaceae bacterium]
MAALIAIPSNLGYLALALLVGGESMGVPLPGETALITAAILAQDGSLQIEVVIAIAAAAAIVGDNLGYLIGRRFGRTLLTRPGRWDARRRNALVAGEAFFDRHGAKAVFFGRFVAALRIWAAWIAGMTHMPWRSFLLWNALGGIAWALSFGLVGYLAGEAVARVIERAGLAAAVLAVIGAAVAFFLIRRRAEHRA